MTFSHFTTDRRKIATPADRAPEVMTFKPLFILKRILNGLRRMLHCRRILYIELEGTGGEKIILTAAPPS